MSKYLSLEDTEKCLKAWRELGDENALTLLITSNRGLINFFAKKHLGQGLTFDELSSAGFEGLLNAINKFNYHDIEIQCFTSYISTSIQNAMRYELKKYNKHSHVLSFSEPIGNSKDGDELTLEDIIGTDNEKLIEDVISEMKIEVVREALKCLTKREQQIMLLRYGMDDKHKKTREEIANIFNCSATTIAKQEQRALIKMRHPRNTRKLKDFVD